MKNKIRLEILTPTECLYADEVSYVQIPLHDGSIGVLPGHTPFVASLGYGMLIARTNATDEHKFVIDAGFVEIVSEQVNILANYAQLQTEIDIKQAQRDFTLAQNSKATGDVAIENRLHKIARARAHIKYASSGKYTKPT